MVTALFEDESTLVNNDNDKEDAFVRIIYNRKEDSEEEEEGGEDN